MDERLLRILPSVSKPARYTNNEINAVHKDWEQISLKIALAFPDVYEIGMGHLGFKILYSIINKRNDALAERVYAAWTDLDVKMREQQIPLSALESGHAISEFDLVGFTLQYELSYSNIITMLDLGGIKRYSAERGEEDPFVMAGGPCAFNVEPLADFLDFVVLGEGEEVIEELIDVSVQAKKQGLSRKERLARIAQVPGVYVPSFYKAHYTKEGHFSHLEPTNPQAPSYIEKRVVQDLDKTSFPDDFVIPYLEVVHDRAMVEVLRGCTRGCRFCQAGMVYRPVRERSKDVLKEQVRNLIDTTGYDEVSLTSLSSGDYTCIEPLVMELINEYKDRGVSVSLPSLRVDSFSVNLAQEIEKSRKTGLTFAPEAGTQRLRDVINKNVTEEELYQVAEGAFQAGWHGIKLYFMIGLPTETQADLDGIAEIAHAVLQIGRKYGKGRKRPEVTVSVSSFVPKPHTPFQWQGQDKPEVLQEKQKYLRKRLQHPGIRFSYNNVETSFLEAVFSRGDRRLGQVLAKAVDLGCQFDSWGEHFQMDKWMEAFRVSGIDPYIFAHRERDLGEPLPWDHLSAGVAKGFLQNEYKAALVEQTTEDCRFSRCTGCAVCFRLDVGNSLTEVSNDG